MNAPLHGAGHGAGLVASVLSLAIRERSRDLLKRAFPRKRFRLQLTRTSQDFELCFRRGIVDLAIIDVAQPTDDTWHAVAMARDYASVPFHALSPMRVADGAALARCMEHDFADVIAEGMDDGALAELVLARGFSARFAQALANANEPLGLETALQSRAWRVVVSHGGRLLRTEAVAKELKVSREHLSRSFAAAGKPNLKRIIDLVRLIAAAELAKNSGYDVSDVARLLEFASPSHLSSTSQRIIGTRSVSLARLRTMDLIERFRQGRGRSRNR